MFFFYFFFLQKRAFRRVWRVGEGLWEQHRGLRDFSHASSGTIGTHTCACTHICVRHMNRVSGWAVTADAGRGLERGGGGWGRGATSIGVHLSTHGCRTATCPLAMNKLLLPGGAAKWLSDGVKRMRTMRLESRHLRCHILGIRDRSARTLIWPWLTLPCGRLKGLSQEIGIHEENLCTSASAGPDC